MNNTTNNTVITEYIASKNTATNQQSEKELEYEFIQVLVENGYEYLRIKNKKDLLEKLHNYTIVNAIHDKTVLPFKADYIHTLNQNDDLIFELELIKQTNIDIDYILGIKNNKINITKDKKNDIYRTISSIPESCPIRRI